MESIVTKLSKTQGQSTHMNARARASIGRTNPKSSRRQTNGRGSSAGKGAEPLKRSKIDSMTAMLRRPKGASVADLCKETGWQAHSVRGAMSAVIKKKLELKVTSTMINGVRFYRVTN
jgi:hypothetical protein